MKRTGLVFVAAALFFMTARGASAQNGVRLLVSNGLKAAMEELQPAAERAIGQPLSMEFNSTAGLRAKIEAGEHFDGALITIEAIGDLVNQGKAASASRVEIGRSPLVIGIRAGSKRNDISTVDALKTTLLQAKSITYPRDGASRGHIDKTFASLGIADALKPKIVLATGSGPATHAVAAGESEMVLTLASETAPIPGIEVLGALPGQYAYEIDFAGAASATTTRGEAVKALFAFLKGSQATTVLRAKGVEAPKAASE